MQLLQRFISGIKQERLFMPQDRLIVAVSGGMDSAVLCELCHQAGFDFTIAHCNFQLRGDESDRDEEFVKGLGNRYNKEVQVKRFDTTQYMQANKLSVQEAARELRYQWFEELVRTASAIMVANPPASTHQTRSAVHLLTAHHADDNNETLLMNFFRGTGLHGLTGIPVRNGSIKRPLLAFTRREITEFAQTQGLAWVEDTSNTSTQYTRNYFRNELIPALTEIYPAVSQNLQGNIVRFREIENLYNRLVEAALKKICVQKGKELHVPVNALLKYNNRALVFALISRYGFSEKQVDEVVKLAQSGSGRYVQSAEGAWRIIRHRLWFIISPVRPADTTNTIIEAGEKEVIFAGGRLQLTEKNAATVLPQSPDTALLDARHISYPLLLRKWKTGDYFYPLGMRKKKKINRFLIDSKLTKTEKENTWVIESGGRIIWVVGRRIDDRFKVTDKSRAALQLALVS